MNILVQAGEQTGEPWRHVSILLQSPPSSSISLHSLSIQARPVSLFFKRSLAGAATANRVVLQTLSTAVNFKTASRKIERLHDSCLTNQRLHGVECLLR